MSSVVLITSFTLHTLNERTHLNEPGTKDVAAYGLQKKTEMSATGTKNRKKYVTHF